MTTTRRAKSAIILVGKNRSSLLFVEFPDFSFPMSPQIFLYQWSAGLKHRVYGKRQTWSNLFHVTKFAICLSFAVHYNYTKISNFTQALSITIVLSCFNLLISHFENSQLESHVFRFPFAVNAVLNLSVVSCRNPTNSSQHYFHIAILNRQ